MEMATKTQQLDAYVSGIIYELDDLGLSQDEIQKLLFKWATDGPRILKLLKEYHGDCD